MARAYLIFAVLLAGSTARADANAGSVAEGRDLLRRGDLAGARAAALGASRSPSKPLAIEGSLLVAELDRATGQLPEARAALEKLVKAHPKHLRARVQLGLLYDETGERKLAEGIWNRFFDEHEAGKLDESTAENLMYLAIAARGLEDFKGAGQTFEEAVRKDPKLAEANVELGWLFLSKYNAAEAEQSFDDAIKVDPENPDAHAGMARVKLEQNYDVRGADLEIEKALRVNPSHRRALLIRAEMQIDNDEYEAAKKTLAGVLAVNPVDLEAHTLLGAVAFMRDDKAAYERERKLVLDQNRLYAPFFHTIAELAVKEHRYQEAIALEQEGLKVDPRYDLALAGIGMGYLRMGDEEQGLKYLRDAFTRDKFNVRTFNYLSLFEDTIPRDYETVTSASGVFRMRVPKDERALLERYLPPMLGRAYDDMTRRYGFKPVLPITLELYNDPDYYSVRTIGLPNLGALGVCFGRVITALSPSNGNVNWGMILWHELAHVFHIQLSNSRVPRWYTEGLAEVETLLTRPEWRRENDIDVWMSISAGKLPSIADLNTRFIHAADMNDMVVAYYLSAVTMEFLVKRWGFPKVVEGLKLYAQGKDTAAVLPAITGLTMDKLDAQLRAFLDERLKVYQGSFKVAPGDYADVTDLEKKAAASPKDPEAQAAVALGWLFEHDGDKARAAAGQALALDPRNKKALWTVAEIAADAGDAAAAQAGYQALIAAGGDGYDPRMRLAGLARARGDMADAETQLKKASALDPERSEPYALLGELYGKTNRDADAIAALERYVMLEQMEYAPMKKLIDKLAARKQWDKVLRYGEIALYVNPFDAELHQTIGAAGVEAGKNDTAIYEYESALKADPPLRRPAIAQMGLARAYAAKKNLVAARAAAAAALKIEPDNVEAQELARKLK